MLKQDITWRNDWLQKHLIKWRASWICAINHIPRQKHASSHQQQAPTDWDDAHYLKLQWDGRRANHAALWVIHENVVRRAF